MEANSSVCFTSFCYWPHESKFSVSKVRASCTLVISIFPKEWNCQLQCNAVTMTYVLSIQIHISGQYFLQHHEIPPKVLLSLVLWLP